MFKDRIYVVTGGAAGIGLAVAAQLLKGGAYVFVLDLHKEATPELAALPGDRLIYMQNDVGNREICHKTIDSIIEKHGKIDGLVNNAGICDLEGESPDDSLYNTVFDTNVRGVWNMGMEVLVRMKDQGKGSVVNIGSVSSMCGVPRIPLYTASKHAVLGFTRTWALDYAKYGVRVNCVAPGLLEHTFRSPQSVANTH